MFSSDHHGFLSTTLLQLKPERRLQLQLNRSCVLPRNVCASTVVPQLSVTVTLTSHPHYKKVKRLQKTARKHLTEDEWYWGNKQWCCFSLFPELKKGVSWKSTKCNAAERRNCFYVEHLELTLEITRYSGGIFETAWQLASEEIKKDYTELYLLWQQSSCLSWEKVLHLMDCQHKQFLCSQVKSH